ncbi:deoxyribodipyrimidine photolyase [Aurantiacibacter atlanticus]|uniref:Deoxyribodipyrimidine photolyase n=1 Tax=Aurantiacibacter atlanticus TaxID=1648404 RepID=A0A0H4VYY5_9SPHN|nr:FAD-dependent oxidoreductase [Aurantiacibacter atlanticus]AKQ42388.1 deoxyribodipyrimidine photolyase [Aurantiacibacter atlanticus]MDF1834494.1 FAD-dependent oxidoreductase [Alteraurantiacibacter sp. bin_em_oilr2.035]
MNIAIIGAGMAGLSCATRLRAQDHDVILFDKGRGPGGRMATRRAEIDGNTLHFDHGAQYFTVSDNGFAEIVSQWEADDVVAQWPVAKEGAWVGTPGMNAPVKAMAAELDVRFGVEIEAFGRSGTGWRFDGDGTPETVFDAVLVAVPAEQAAVLLGPHSPQMAETAKSSVSLPCWAVMAAFATPLDHEDIIRDAGAIGWAARNSAKPGRSNKGGLDCWVVQASPDWSREHLDDDGETIATLLLEELGNQTDITMPEAVHSAAHRWLYAESGSTAQKALWNADACLGACGDWLIGPRVEAAFVSGVTLADTILTTG